MDAPTNGRPMGARRAAYTLYRVSARAPPPASPPGVACVSGFARARTLLRNLSFVFPGGITPDVVCVERARSYRVGLGCLG